MRLLITLILALLSFCGMAETTAAPAFQKPPPGELIDIGGRRLHVLCKGTAAGATSIFEAGLSQWTAHSTYGKAQDAIATFTRACAYDRAGLGWSDPAAPGRGFEDMVDDLHRLLAAAKVPGMDIGWRKSQEQLSSLSSDSLFMVAERAGHVIPYEDPSVVVDAVRRMLEARRAGARLLP